MKNTTTLNHEEIKRLTLMHEFEKEEFVTIGKETERVLFIIKIGIFNGYKTKRMFEAKYMIEKILDKIMSNICLINKKLDQDRILLKRLN